MSLRNDILTDHYLKNYDRLVKRSTWRVPNRSVHLAEECVQEAYLRALRYFKTFNPQIDSIDRWFEGILRNSINDCRSIEKDKGVVYELNEEDALTPDRQERIIAESVLNTLEDNRTTLILKMFLLYGYKTREISEFTGLTHGNVRQIISRWRITNS